MWPHDLYTAKKCKYCSIPTKMLTIQGVPDRVSNKVTVALHGKPPVECTVHKNILELFR